MGVGEGVDVSVGVSEGVMVRVGVSEAVLVAVATGTVGDGVIMGGLQPINKEINRHTVRSFDECNFIADLLFIALLVVLLIPFPFQSVLHGFHGWDWV